MYNNSEILVHLNFERSVHPAGHLKTVLLFLTFTTVSLFQANNGAAKLVYSGCIKLNLNITKTRTDLERESDELHE